MADGPGGWYKRPAIADLAGFQMAVDRRKPSHRRVDDETRRRQHFRIGVSVASVDPRRHRRGSYREPVFGPRTAGPLREHLHRWEPVRSSHTRLPSSATPASPSENNRPSSTAVRTRGGVHSSPEASDRAGAPSTTRSVTVPLRQTGRCVTSTGPPRSSTTSWTFNSENGCTRAALPPSGPIIADVASSGWQPSGSAGHASPGPNAGSSTARMPSGEGSSP